MKVTLGLSLSLTGAFSRIGQQTEDSLRLFVADTNAAGGVRLDQGRATLALRCHDDRSDPSRCAAIYRELCAAPNVDVILGPYSSELTAQAAPVAESAGRLFVNHAGAADSLYTQGYRMIIGMQTPASQYLYEFIGLLASLNLWRNRVGMVVEGTNFSRAIAQGAAAALQKDSARRAGLRMSPHWDGALTPSDSDDSLVQRLRHSRINALVVAGSYQHDLAIIRTVLRSGRHIPAIVCVAAGLSRFHEDLGEAAEGVLGTSQWEPNFEAIPELGPDPREFSHRMRTQTRTGECDYVAAQAYAAGVLVVAVLEQLGSCEQVRMRERFSALRTGTLFGAFEIDGASGQQVAHKMRTVQWRDGRKVIVSANPVRDRHAMEWISPWSPLRAKVKALLS